MFQALGVHGPVLNIDEKPGLARFVTGVAGQVVNRTAKHQRLLALILLTQPQEPARKLLLRDRHKKLLAKRLRARVPQEDVGSGPGPLGPVLSPRHQRV